MTWSPEVHALGDDWRRIIGGIPPRSRLAHMRKELAEFPFSQVQIHWQHYLSSHHNGRSIFASPEIFTRTFTQWAPPTQSVVRMPYQGRSVDECDRAAGIPIKPEP